MLSIKQALTALTDSVRPQTHFDTVPLKHGLDRIVAKDIIALTHVPPAANSAMDGYAIYTETALVAGTTLEVSQTIAAGTAPKPLKPNTAARIFTGAELPSNANTVVIQENVSVNSDAQPDTAVETCAGGVITLLHHAKAGANVRPAGQDIQQGEVIAQAGERLGAAHLGVLASTGISHLDVYRRLKVGVLNTGQELIAPGSPLAQGQIYNSNQFTLSALLSQLGCDVVVTESLPDNLNATIDALQRCGAQCDLVITSGGVSVGDEDHVKAALQTLGRLDLWKIKLKPGKPLAFGHIEAAAGKAKTPVLGLPGNPVSAYVTFLLFGAPMIKKMQNRNAFSPPKAWPMPADFTLSKPASRPEFVRVRRTPSGLALYPNQSSGVLRSVQWAEGLALVPENTAINKGDCVEFFPFHELMQ